MTMHKLCDNVSCSLLTSWQTTQYSLTLTTPHANALHACVQWTNAGYKMSHGSCEQQCCENNDKHSKIEQIEGAPVALA